MYLLPPASMPPTPVVNPRIPFSLLEALRRIDTPESDVETEYVHELRNKRLGLSETVYQQIRRYGDAVKRGQLLPWSEAAGLGALIARRPDADELFRSAGLIIARDIYSAIPMMKRRMMHILPGFMARPIAFAELKRASTRFFGGAITRTDSFLNLTVPDAVVVSGGGGPLGCVYYETALREILRLLIDARTEVEHTRCTQRGDSACEWRAEWSAHK